MLFSRLLSRTLGLLLLLGLPAAPASALTVTLSDMSSEPTTNPAGDLFADVIFSVGNCDGNTCDVTITIDNRTDENASGVTYDINELGFNSIFAVDGVANLELTYVSATHSVNNDVTALWSFQEQTLAGGGPTQLDGFGVFDYALFDGVGPSLGQVNPGTQVTFLFTVADSIIVDDNDFFAESDQTPTGDQMLKLVTAKFVEMSPVGSYTCGQDGTGACDSAYGGTAIPEPGTALLMGLGLLGLGFGGRRRA